MLVHGRFNGYFNTFTYRIQAQLCVASATSSGRGNAAAQEILSGYRSGLLVALKYQARRVSFDQAMDRALHSGLEGY